MKVTVNWLKQYVDFDWSTEVLTERLTMLGIEVEGVVAIRGDFEGVVVAEVLTRDKHPNADKLSVCRVADGTGERQIVCGAQNFKPGDKVPLILPGSTLPPKPGDKEPFTIKVGKIRGVESHGMMCSAQELGLPAGDDGLLILPTNAVVGQPLATHLGRPGSDTVFDLEITPNRPDLNSLIGIAREISALTGSPLRLPAVTAAGEATPAAATGWLQLRLEAPDLCPRYTARLIRNVKIGPSPDWLRASIERVGLRSINNVVDVTNFVMLETGQPLHAFDYHAIARGDSGIPTIVVRRANPGETITTLDGQHRSLPAEALLIADPTMGLALAGVMGGRSSEITPSTVDVLLESACFKPSNIRRTSKATGLRTDASYRYERGADIGAVEFASRRAAALLVEWAGGALQPELVETYPTHVLLREVSVRPTRVNSLLGTQLSSQDIDGYLTKLGFSTPPLRLNGSAPEIAPDPILTYQVPSHRVDIKREVDLIEEVARLYGVNQIPTTTPHGSMGSHSFDSIFDQLAEARRLLSALGLEEAQGQTLINSRNARPFLPQGIDVVALSNPLSSDMDVLRPSLLPGLLDSLRHNLHQRNGDVRLFEIGRVISQSEGKIREGWRVAILLTGSRQNSFWMGAERDARSDAFDLKGVLEEFLDGYGISGTTWSASSVHTSFLLEGADISLGGRVPLGFLGQLVPALARENDARDPVLLAELDLDSLLRRRSTSVAFELLPQFPSVRRDLALVVPEAVHHESILQAIRKVKAPNLESVQLFDLFRGGQVAEGHKSMAYAFTYRAADRTLREEEVTAAQARVTEALRQNFGAILRE